MKNWVLGVLMLSAVPIDAAAQSCTFEQEILTAADRILEIRPQLSFFSVARYGADAVYFKLHYERLDIEQGLTLIEQVTSQTGRPPRRLNAVREAFVISNLGAEDGISYLGDSRVQVFSDLSNDGIRAVILSDGGASFFKLRAELPSDAALDGFSIADESFPASAAAAIIDQPDAFLVEFAKLSEAAGAFDIAGYVLSSRIDLALYNELTQRYEDDARFTAYWWKALDRGFLLRNDDERTERLMPSISEPPFSNRENFSHVIAVHAQGADNGSLYILLNQTLEYKLGDVARAYLAALEAGQSELEQDVDAAGAFILREMVARIGQDESFRMLEMFGMSYDSRHYNNRIALQAFSWSAAKRVLQDYLTSEGILPVMKPSFLPPEIDWAQWVRIARWVKTGDVPALIDMDDRTIAAELLFTKGDFKAALAMARGLEMRDESRVLKDFMRRLDRRCGGYSMFPRQSQLFGNIVLYRFQ